MYSLKMNYRLLGKQSIASNALVQKKKLKNMVYLILRN